MSDPPPAAHARSVLQNTDERRVLPVWIASLVTLFVWAVLIWLFLYFFNSVRMVFLDLLAAGALASMLRPLLRYARGPHWLRGVTVGVAFIILSSGVVAGLIFLLRAPIRHELQQWPQIRQGVDHILFYWSDKLDLDPPLDIQTVLSRLAEFLTGAGGAATGRLIGRTADLAVSIGVTLALVFVGMVYILVEPPDGLLAPIARMLPPQRRDDLRGAIDALSFRLRWWLIGVLIAISIIGITSWIGYAIVGLKFALPLAVFAGIAEIAPNIGAMTAFAIAIIVAATQGTGVLAGVVVVHSITLFLESHVIQPLVMRGAVKVPPIVTLFSVVLWAEVFGVGGLILALPIDLLLWSAAENFILHDRSGGQAPKVARRKWNILKKLRR